MCEAATFSFALFTEGSQPSGFTASPAEFRLNLRPYLLPWNLHFLTIFRSSWHKKPRYLVPFTPKALACCLPSWGQALPSGPLPSGSRQSVSRGLSHPFSDTGQSALRLLPSTRLVISLKAWPLAWRELSLLRLCVIPGIWLYVRYLSKKVRATHPSKHAVLTPTPEEPLRDHVSVTLDWTDKDPSRGKVSRACPRLAEPRTPAVSRDSTSPPYCVLGWPRGPGQRSRVQLPTVHCALPVASSRFKKQTMN